jgi:hypothetical protein
MDPDPTEPLSLEEAKDRLRAAARDTGPAGWVRRHPREALALALLGGMALGNVPVARETLVQGLVRVLFTTR